MQILFLPDELRVNVLLLRVLHRDLVLQPANYLLLALNLRRHGLQLQRLVPETLIGIKAIELHVLRIAYSLLAVIDRYFVVLVEGELAVDLGHFGFRERDVREKLLGLVVSRPLRLREKINGLVVVLG